MFPSVTFRTAKTELAWETVSIGKGESMTGCIAGKVVVTETHWIYDHRSPKGRSVGCRSFLSAGKLACLCAIKPLGTRILGYCPLITTDRKRYVVTLSESVAKKVVDIKPGTAIKLARPQTGIRPLTVSLVPDTEVGGRFAAVMRAAACHDIHEYLLHLWQDQELTEHFGFEFVPAREPNPVPDGEQPAV